MDHSMRPHSYVEYFNQEIASSTAHEAINKKKVDLSKPVTYFSWRKVGRTQHERGMSTHQRVENRIAQLK